jgi:ATP-dependent helicase/DNAse subunit B
MLLLSGPAGSGKTSFVLDRFREALTRHDSAVRLLVPTATMARHIQNRLAREGFLLRPSLVQTLSRFIEPLAADLPQVSDSHLYLIVEDAARRVNRPEFARVVHMPGFCASLARAIEEFSAAGCDSRRLARHLPAAPLAEALLAVFEEVNRELARRGLSLRSTRLERVAARILERGIPGLSTVWLDGFHALPDPELAVIEALARRADTTVTLPSAELTAPLRARLLAMGFTEQVLERRRPRPEVHLVQAPRIEREADEIARRILEAGRPFREIGVILRAPDIYQPILRAAFDRFGIPARFYLDSELVRHPIIRYLAGIVDALLGGWDYAATLVVLRLHPSLGNSNAMDEFDFQVRQRLQIGQASWPPINELLDRLRALDPWRAQKLLPAAWARNLQSLAAFYQPSPPPDAPSREQSLIWRSAAPVLEAFAEAIAETAAWFQPPRPIPLAEFWRAVKATLRLTPLRLDDDRRNVVHVLNAYEARQWELPVIFVCGLVEKEFPRYSPQDAFFPDPARRQLQSAGIRLRTTADAAMEEEFLFDSAVTRATATLTLSYPKLDGRGEQNLPSIFLERFPLAPSPVKLVLPRLAPLSAPHLPPGRIADAGLRELLAVRHRALRATAVESYLQCPFQFFARYTLDLREPPSPPAARLDARVQGTIVHQVIAEWLRSPSQPIEPIFDRIFAETCRDESIPSGFHTAAVRDQMLRDLARFAANTDRPATPATQAEVPFEFELPDSVSLRGRIDRLDLTPAGRADVVDYKYSKKDYSKQVNRLQGPLYLLAVEKALGYLAGEMSYCGLRGEVKYAPQPLTRDDLRSAAETTLRVAAEVRSGNAAPQPADLAPCRYCAFKDICRYQAAAGALIVAEGA